MDKGPDYTQVDILSRLRQKSPASKRGTVTTRKTDQGQTTTTITTATIAKTATTKKEEIGRHSLTYGEFTKGALETIIDMMKSVSDIIKAADIPHVSKNKKMKESYDLGENSIFLDLGSGAGKPCIHAAITCNCLAMGLELHEGRI